MVYAMRLRDAPDAMWQDEEIDRHGPCSLQLWRLRRPAHRTLALLVDDRLLDEIDPATELTDTDRDRLSSSSFEAGVGDIVRNVELFLAQS